MKTDTMFDHLTSAGNLIHVSMSCHFERTTDWLIRRRCFVDGVHAEYRGHEMEINGVKYALVHVRDKGTYGVPLEKWAEPEPPRSDEWKELLACIAESPVWKFNRYIGESEEQLLARRKRIDKAVEEVLVSHTVEGRAAIYCRDICQWRKNEQEKRDYAALVLGRNSTPMGMLIHWLTEARQVLFKKPATEKSRSRRDITI